LFLLRALVRLIVEVVARNNLLGLRTMIARERGIGAYQAWLPLERIRPPNIPQGVWEERFAWPASNKPPYRPFIQRVGFALLGYTILLSLIAAILELLAPSVLTWLGGFMKTIIGEVGGQL
jgi:hypothetical protein